MKTRKLVVAATAAVVALSFSVAAFAGTQTRDRIRIPGSGPTCPR